MTKQIWCWPDDDFCDAQSEQTNLVLVSKRIVIWAGELTEPGGAVGGISTQNNRASRLLEQPLGVIHRARYERSGPEIFPSIWASYQKLLARIASEQRRRQSSPGRGDIHLPRVRPDGNANQEIRGLRETTGTRAEILRVMPESARQGSSPKKMRA